MPTLMQSAQAWASWTPCSADRPRPDVILMDLELPSILLEAGALAGGCDTGGRVLSEPHGNAAVSFLLGLISLVVLGGWLDARLNWPRAGRHASS
jgi:hypothetical protein